MENKPFGYFPHGKVNNKGEKVMDNRPKGEFDFPDVRDYIVSQKAKFPQDQLQMIPDHKERQLFKLMNFEYVTFAGRFNYRNTQGIAQESGFMVLDIDGLKDADEVLRVRDIFIKDTRVESAMVFTSPSQLGVKAVVKRCNDWGKTFKEQFQWLTRYFIFEYGIKLDQSGSDITRPCYLPYDPTCYINPKYTI